MGRLLAENCEEHERPKNLEQLTEIFFTITAVGGWEISL